MRTANKVLDILTIWLVLVLGDKTIQRIKRHRQYQLQRRAASKKD